jgi:1-acyl-sn-glycerol-3-phosphate acyltransferase
MGLPIYIVVMRGGYNTKPRWKSKPNKGKMRASITRFIDTEELKATPTEELEEIIRKELYFNEFEWNAKEQIVFRRRHKAEFLERMLFYCPDCHSLDGLSSKKCEFFCTLCGLRVLINGTGFFERINSKNSPDTILEWSKMQLEYIKSIDYSKYLEKPLFSDKNVRLSLAIRSKKDELLGSGPIELFGDKIRICSKDFDVEKLKDMSIQSYNRLMIYYEDGEFTVDMSSRDNAVKYMICGYHLKNIALNIENGHYGY